MAHISIVGTGNMGQALAGLAGKGGHTVELLNSSDAGKAVTGDIEALAFLQITLAAGEKISWTGGFAVVA